MDLVKSLENYFKNTPNDIIEKQFKEISEKYSFGPTVDEYIDYAMQFHIIDFYNNFVLKNKDYLTEKWERGLCEEYRNSLAKHFGFPQGHRWEYENWFDIQEKAFKLLLEKNLITNDEYIFYIKKFKF